MPQNPIFFPFPSLFCFKMIKLANMRLKKKKKSKKGLEMLCKNSREEKSSTWLGAVITISSGPGGLYIPELPSQGSAYRCATSTSGTGGVTRVGWVLTASALLLRPRSPIHTIIWDRDRQENVPPLPPLTPKESPTSHTPRGVPSESSHPARHPQWSRHFPKTAPTAQNRHRNDEGPRLPVGSGPEPPLARSGGFRSQRGLLRSGTQTPSPTDSDSAPRSLP